MLDESTFTMPINCHVDFRIARWLPQRPTVEEIEAWLAGDERRAICVKHNRKRSVYALRSAASAVPSYFLKHDHPGQWGDIIRSWIYPKVLQEFRVLERLQENNVPAVKPVACAWRCGQGILITEALTGAATFMELWPRVQADQKRRQPLLAALAELVRRMIQARVFHPDLHFGNILVGERGQRLVCVLVDVHGVKRLRKWSVQRQALMLRALAVWGQNLEDEEIHDWLAAVFPQASAGWLEAFWQLVFQEAVEEARRKWPGRRRKIMNAQGRSNSICSLATTSDGIWRWRTDFDVNIAREVVEQYRRRKALPSAGKESPGDVSLVAVAGKTFRVREFGCSDPTTAEQIWLTHWRLEMAGFPVPRCMAWFSALEGTSYLVAEHLDGVSLSDALREAEKHDLQRNILLGRLWKLLTNLYRWNFFHQNLQVQMITVCRRNDTVRLFLTDLDAMQFDDVVRKEHLQLNFEALRNSLPSDSEIRKLFSKFFRDRKKSV